MSGMERCSYLRINWVWSQIKQLTEYYNNIWSTV
jgi:hypothetical protein